MGEHADHTTLPTHVNSAGESCRQREPLRTLDLFSGIGGFAKGLEHARGFRTVAFCETGKHASAILARHWPSIPNIGDVRGAVHG